MGYDNGFLGAGLLCQIDIQRPEAEEEEPFLCPCCGQPRYYESGIEVDGVLVCNECAEGLAEGMDFRDDE